MYSMRYLGDQKIIFNFLCLELGGPWTLSTLPTPSLRHCTHLLSGAESAEGDYE